MPPSPPRPNGFGLDDDDPGPPLRIGRRRVRLSLAALDAGEPTAMHRREPARGPEIRTPGQRRRWRRNLLIALGARHGMSQSWLAEVFDLPRSRIGEIVAEVHAYQLPTS